MYDNNDICLESLREIERMVQAGSGLQRGMERLIELGTLHHPEAVLADWKTRRWDMRDLANWLDGLDALKFWREHEWDVKSWVFVLFEPVDCTSGVSTCGMYPWATSTPGWHDPDQQSWTLDFELWPRALGKMFAEIREISDYDVSNYFEYSLCLGYASLAISEFISVRQRDMYFERSVFVCWQSGDNVQLKSA